jgi:hypothetical protein
MNLLMTLALEPPFGTLVDVVGITSKEIVDYVS